MEERKELLRKLPRVDRVAEHARLAEVRARLGSALVTELVRAALADARVEVLGGADVPDEGAVAERAGRKAEALFLRRARRVVNATGVVLHTNLGRAPLGERAVRALAEQAGGYSSIELDLETGRRGARGAFAERALAELAGAEDALVVNNNAAAVLLVLTALARGRGVVVSRGELVEIGGGFRVPDVLARSGARMLEVGTTNRTRIDDYRAALDAGEDVAVLLRVHQGNFRQVGFVERPPLAALAELARARGVLLVKDLGGGALVDLGEAGLAGEPTARACVGAGAHLVCFSTDKLAGGPQGGAVVGERGLVAAIRRDPLARALRLGRLPMVALEATLGCYLEGRCDEVPALAALRAPLEEIRARVTRWQEALASRGLAARVVDVEAAAGGGALAEVPVASVALAVEVTGISADELARRLRAGEPPILARITGDVLLCDGRTVLAGEDEALIAGVAGAASAKEVSLVP
jgi:L-seryl-tRNA(Ser) seleniumtransferase